MEGMSLGSKNQLPMVSIITVVFNGDKHLQQTIDSVINQTYKNIEYIIIDGGSTDQTLEILKANTKNISKWISEPDEGLYDAMNKGIELTQGEIIGMVNSDDWYELDAVEIMVGAFLNNPTKNIFHADRYDIMSDGQKRLYKHHPSAMKFKFWGMTYNHPTMFISRKEYTKHQYNIQLGVLSDYQFILEAYLREPDVLFYVQKAIVNYRLDGLSTRMSMKSMLLEGFIARQNAGLSLLENIVAFKVRLSFRLISSIINMLKIKNK
ncbi:glycosyltransferase [Flavobacteriales bacterium]|nr:glycosyltransferase [Flavobacteriales bacterium]